MFFIFLITERTGWEGQPTQVLVRNNSHCIYWGWVCIKTHVNGQNRRWKEDLQTTAFSQHDCGFYKEKRERSRNKRRKIQKSLRVIIITKQHNFRTMELFLSGWNRIVSETRCNESKGCVHFTSLTVHFRFTSGLWLSSIVCFAVLFWLFALPCRKMLR